MLKEDLFKKKNSESIDDLPQSLKEKLDNFEDFEILSSNYSMS